MNQAGVQAKIDYGYGKVAQILGQSCQWYRASASDTVIDPTTLKGSVNILINPDPKFLGVKPNLYAHPEVAAAFDRTGALAGDVYVTADNQVYFLAAVQPLLASYLINCNHTINVYRPGQDTTTPSADYYGGNVSGTGLPILLNWPASILQGTKGEVDTGIVGATRTPWVAILFPAFGDIQIDTNDLLIDETNERYQISSTELTDLGWRLTATYAGV